MTPVTMNESQSLVDQGKRNMRDAYDKACDFFDSTNLRYTDIDVLKLEQLLKDQDRDTRHACAEAVITMKVERTKMSTNRGRFVGEVIPTTLEDVKAAAHNIVINCRKGVEP